jgi:hypothetical protein
MKRLTALLLGIFLVLGTVGCAGPPPGGSRTTVGSGSQQSAAKAAYTIMVYVDGSNLESESGLATEDMNEMIASRFPRGTVNVVVQTGGSTQWQMNGVSASNIGRYLVAENDLQQLESLPQQNMVEPATLTDFINYAYERYPADHYGIVMWDHGAGPVFGYGVDDNYSSQDSLYIDELAQALKNSAAARQPFEFIGFDSCLMSTIEIASLLAPYGHYLISSQELEPGQGWDYTSWLNALGASPTMNGEAIGKAVSDSFIKFYENTDQGGIPLLLSVIDMSKTQPVVKALEDLVGATDPAQLNFQEVARERSNMRDFGLMPNDPTSYFDVVDLADMAKQLSAKDPSKGAALTDAVSKAVLYNAKGSYNDTASGLSIYFPSSRSLSVEESMRIYESTGFSPVYLNYLKGFVNKLISSGTLAPMDNIYSMLPSQAEQAGVGAGYRLTLPPEQMQNIDTVYLATWQRQPDGSFRQVYRDGNAQIDYTTGSVHSGFTGSVSLLNGDVAYLHESDRGQGYVRYLVPAVHNGKDVNLQVLVDDANPQGKILGAVPVDTNTYMAARQLIPVKEGDTLALSYYTKEATAAGTNAQGARVDTAAWRSGETRTVGKDFALSAGNLPAGEYLYRFAVVDLQGKTYETDFITVTH